MLLATGSIVIDPPQPERCPPSFAVPLPPSRPIVKRWPKPMLIVPAYYLRKPKAT